MRVLNRIVEWTPKGITYEADQRHAEIICRDLGLKEKSKGVSTPGVKPKANTKEEKELNPSQATQFRAMVARANYLAQDRPDIQFATKELCREMSKPRERSWNSLKRLGRYLQANPRYVQEFKRQGKQTHITAWVDTDYAGCLRTRKSTSGGLINIGSHLVKSWSATQTDSTVIWRDRVLWGS